MADSNKITYTVKNSLHFFYFPYGIGYVTMLFPHSFKDLLYE